MKKIINTGIILSTILLLSGCYTQLAVSDSEPDYYEPPIIINIDPAPLPIPPPDPPLYYINEPKEKIRTPESLPKARDNGIDRIRDGGSRNNSGKRNRR